MKEKYQNYKGSNFIFHLLDEDNTICIGLSSNYVYPPVSKEELKNLTDFILKYLENK